MIKYGIGDVYLMGTVNLTPDSFYASSRADADRVCSKGLYLPDVDDALRRIDRLLTDGADVIDIGACSTRPGAGYVSVEEEWMRLEKVLKVFRHEFGMTPLSIDTFRADIAVMSAQAAGNIIINDVAGCEMDRMLETAASRGLAYVATHGAGLADSSVDYPEGVTAAVHRFFEDFSRKAESAGVRNWIMDPGLGFSKSVAQNWELLGQCSQLLDIGRPMLIGYSHKRMIYEPLGITRHELNAGLTGYRKRLFDAQSRRAFEMAVQQGASIIRLHDLNI